MQNQGKGIRPWLRRGVSGSLLWAASLGACGGGSNTQRTSPMDAGMDVGSQDAPTLATDSVHTGDTATTADTAEKNDVAVAKDVAQAIDLPPDSAPPSPNTSEQACLAATNVPVCDTKASSARVQIADGESLISGIEMKTGPCTVMSMDGAYSIALQSPLTSAPPDGTECAFLVSQKNGAQQIVRVVVQTTTRPPRCCGYPIPPYQGQWVSLRTVQLSPNPVVIRAPADGGAPSLDADTPDAEAGD